MANVDIHSATANQNEDGSLELAVSIFVSEAALAPFKDSKPEVAFEVAGEELKITVKAAPSKAAVKAGKPLDDMTKAQLQKQGRKEGVDLADSVKRDDMQAQIEEGRK